MTGLVTAHASAYCQSVALVQAWGTGPASWAGPEAALLLADALDVQLGATIAKVALLRHEAKRVIEERKAAH